MVYFRKCIWAQLTSLAIRAMLIFIFLPAASHARPIVAAGDADFPPYQFLRNGVPCGFETDLVNAIAEVMSMDIHIYLYDWNVTRAKFDSGKVDFITGMYYTPEREKTIGFSMPYMQISNDIFVRKGSNIRYFTDIQDKNILVQRSDLFHEMLLNSGTSRNIIPITSPPEALKLLSQGIGDCAIMPKYLGMFLIDSLNITNIRNLNENMLQQRYCFAVQKNNPELLRLLNEGLSILNANGTYSRIYEKWFGRRENKYTFNVISKYFVYILVAGSSVAILVFFWIWSLRRKVAAKTETIKQEYEQRIKMQTALEESEQKFRIITEMSVTGVFIIVNDYFRYVNPRFAEIFGYSRDEMINMNFRSLLPMDNMDEVNKVNETVRTGFENVMQIRFSALRSDGTIINVAALGNSYENAGEKIIIGSLIDITAQVKAENEIIKLNRELEKKVKERTFQLEKTLKELKLENAVRVKVEEHLREAKNNMVQAYENEKKLGEMKTRFISMVSHEYRTPLTVILSSTFLLEQFYKSRSDIDFDKYLNRIRSSVNNMTELLEEVLMIGRLESEELKSSFVHLDIRAFCRSMIEEILLFDKNKHPVNLLIDDSIPGALLLDEKLLRQTIINLLSNAVKYSAENEPVDLNVSLDKNGSTMFRVIDRGIGIPEEDLPEIFTTFHRAKNVGTKPGTGLGLGIVKRSVEKMNGKISISSKIGKGTEVTIELPNAENNVATGNGSNKV